MNAAVEEARMLRVRSSYSHHAVPSRDAAILRDQSGWRRARRARIAPEELDRLLLEAEALAAKLRELLARLP